MAGQAGNKMLMLGMILVTGEKPNSRERFHCLKGYGIIEETGNGPQLMPTISPSACACSQELEHFHIHQDLPISMSRILATQHTTMRNTGGESRCKGG